VQDAIIEVKNETASLSNAVPVMDGTASAGVGTAASRDDHRHPTDTSRAPVSAMTATGTSFTPFGNIAATNVQAAIQELDNEKAALSGAVFGGSVGARMGFFANTGGLGYVFDNDGDTGMVNPVDGQLSFNCNGAELLRLNNQSVVFGNLPGSRYWTAQSNGNLVGNNTSITLGSFGGTDSAPVTFNAPGYPNAGAIYGTHMPGNWVGTTIMAGNGIAFFTLRNNGVGYAQGGWQTGSDERLKDNITLIPEALSKLTSMRGCTFYRNDLKKEMAGIIAQDLQAVLPQGVSVFEAEQQLLSVDPMAVIALLVEAVKELKVEVDTLKGKL
jgi:hypothetical protein